MVQLEEIEILFHHDYKADLHAGPNDGWRPPVATSTITIIITKSIIITLIILKNI